MPRADTLLLVLALSGCGRVVAAGGEPNVGDDPSKVATATSRALREPRDLIPADLDLVLRLDLRTIRESLGTAGTEAMLTKGFAEARLDESAREALRDAAVVWLGLRLSDLTMGDRVLVVERQGRPLPVPDLERWTRARSGVEGVERYVSRAPIARDGTAEILDLERARAFVSPVEAASVRRVLTRGPDPLRGDPEARGLLSFDAKPGRPSADRMARHPSFGGLVASLERVRGAVELHQGSLSLQGRLTCASPTAAERIARFLRAFREASDDRASLRDKLGALEAEANERTVVVRWQMPTDLVLALLSDEGAEPERPDSR
jgi:hypothetical protein